MLSHVHVGISDYDRALAFYSEVLSELGLERRFADRENGWAGWMKAGVVRPLFLIGLPFDRRAASAGNGQMVALLADNRTMVDRCHALALSLGGVDEGAPGLRPHYHANYYGAYFRDPDGNKICICCHDPVPAADTRDMGLPELVSRYCAAWNERDATRRHAMLREVWSSESVYIDPSAHVVGIMSLVVHIGMVAARNPRSSIIMTSAVDAHHDEMRFGWARIREDGGVIASGIDFAQRSEAGLLVRVVGFLGDLPALETTPPS